MLKQLPGGVTPASQYASTYRTRWKNVRLRWFNCVSYLYFPLYFPHHTFSSTHVWPKGCAMPACNMWEMQYDHQLFILPAVNLFFHAISQLGIVQRFFPCRKSRTSFSQYQTICPNICQLGMGALIEHPQERRAGIWPSSHSSNHSRFEVSGISIYLVLNDAHSFKPNQAMRADFKISLIKKELVWFETGRPPPFHFPLLGKNSVKPVSPPVHCCRAWSRLHQICHHWGDISDQGISLIQFSELLLSQRKRVPLICMVRKVITTCQ